MFWILGAEREREGEGGESEDGSAMRDRTEDLRDRCASTASPGYYNGGPVSEKNQRPFRSKLETASEARKLSSSLYTNAFHRRALSLSEALCGVLGDLQRLAKERGTRRNIGGGGSRQDQHAELASVAREAAKSVDALRVEVESMGKKGHLSAHRLGVVAILTARLADVGRAQGSLLSLNGGSEGGPGQDQEGVWSSRSRRARLGGLTKRPTSGFDPSSSLPVASSNVSGDPAQQQLLQENDALLRELEGANDQALAAHRALVEISELNSVFSQQVQEQGEQLEALYEEAVQTAQNFRSGNVELAKALRRNKQGGRYVLYIILFFTAALLLMDWWHG